MRTAAPMVLRPLAKHSVSTAKDLAEGRLTLQELRGYSDESLNAVARQAIILFQQGKTQDARTLFQGLAAVSPNNAYFARLLGVAECAAGQWEAALAAFDVAIQLAPEDASGYVGRAEALVAAGQRVRAREDLERAVHLRGDARMSAKARAMLAALAGS